MTMQSATRGQVSLFVEFELETSDIISVASTLTMSFSILRDFVISSPSLKAQSSARRMEKSQLHEKRLGPNFRWNHE